MKHFGIIGWKNSGKTGLMERLVTEIRSRGFAVSTIKRTHHAVDLDPAGTDTYRHRAAGAAQVMLASDSRMVLMQEHSEPPRLEELLARITPVDLVLVEGFKSEGHPKIECRRSEVTQPPLFPDMPSVKAVATDHQIDAGIPQFDLNATTEIADFILTETGLG